MVGAGVGRRLPRRSGLITSAEFPVELQRAVARVAQAECGRDASTPVTGNVRYVGRAASPGIRALAA